jgi:hypothetical protein
VTGDRGAANRTLVPGRRDHDNSATQGEIKRLLEASLASWEGTLEGNAQIDNPRARVDDVEYGLGKVLGICIWQMLDVRGGVGEDRPHKKAAPRADCRCHRFPPRKQNAGYKCAVSACRVAGVNTGTRQFPGDFANILHGEIRVIEHQRSIDQPDRDLGLPLRT